MNNSSKEEIGLITENGSVPERNLVLNRNDFHVKAHKLHTIQVNHQAEFVENERVNNFHIKSTREERLSLKYVEPNYVEIDFDKEYHDYCYGDDNRLSNHHYHLGNEKKACKSDSDDDEDSDDFPCDSYDETYNNGNVDDYNNQSSPNYIYCNSPYSDYEYERYKLYSD